MNRKSRRKLGVMGGAAALAMAGTTGIVHANTVGVSDAAALLTASSDPFDHSFTIDSGAMKGDTFTPSGNFTVNSFYGPQVGQPGQLDTFQGHETFTVSNADGTELGTVDAVVSHSVGAGNPNLEILVLGANPADGVSASNLPTDGSVFNFGWSANDPSVLTNTYSDIAGENALTWHAFGEGASAYDGGEATNGSLIGLISNTDYSEHLLAQNALVGESDFQLPNGDHLIAVPGTEHITAVTNTSPYAIAVQGVSQFNEVDANGDVVGTFEGNTISTADLAGGHSFEIEVTGGQTLADGTVASVANGDLGSDTGQLPTDGSIFNMLYLFSPQAYNVYTDYNMEPLGQSNEVSQLWNMFGMQWDTTPSFDAVKDMTDGGNLFNTIPYLNDAEITPENVLDVTGINGMPNGGVNGLTSDVLGQQEFSMNGQSFWADVSDYANGNGTTAESLYIDAALNADHGISSAELPSGISAGSEIDFTDGGWWQSLQIDTDPLDSSAGDITQMISIPFLGGDWVDIDPSSDWLLAMAGIIF